MHDDFASALARRGLAFRDVAVGSDLSQEFNEAFSLRQTCIGQTQVKSQIGLYIQDQIVFAFTPNHQALLRIDAAIRYDFGAIGLQLDGIEPAVNARTVLDNEYIANCSCSEG